MTDFVELVRPYRQKPLWSAGEHTQTHLLAQGEVEPLIPHRSPFLFIDRVRSVDFTQQALLAEHDLSPALPVFAGHFPGEPIYPGVLQIEVLAQAALIYLGLARAERGADAESGSARVSARALKIHYAEFVRSVIPPLRLEALVREIDDSGYTRTFVGQLNAEGLTRSVAIVEVYLVE